MVRNLILVNTLILLLSSMTACSQVSEKENPTSVSTSYNTLSQSFLDLIKQGKNTENIVNAYANIDLDALESELNTHEKKLAFWINTYNGFIMQILSKNPELFEDRSAFYIETPINIGGETLTFDIIEHGIIRNSRWKYGLGYIKKLSAKPIEKKFRTDQKDGRVHFALNCGAISCPPVAIYKPETLDAQMDKIIPAYLKTVTEVKDGKLITSPLFSWFRGDFGGKSGIKKFLANYGLWEDDKLKLEFGSYDWTLLLGNFVE